MTTPEPPGPHADPDELVAAALGHPPSPGDEELAAHLRGCARCREELAALRRVVTSARGGEPAARATGAAPRALPPPRVWDAVAAATGVSTAPRPEVLEASLHESPSAPGSPGAPGTTGTAGATEATHPVAPADPADPDRALPVPRPVPRPAPRRRWRTRALAAAAAAGLVGGGLVGALVGRATSGGGGDGDGGAPAPGPAAVAARADLAPAQPRLPDAAGSAEVLGSGAQRRLLVSTTGLPAVTGSGHEVWLLDPATGAVLPLGFLTPAGSGPASGFPVPEGVDLAAWSVVDVSAEPIDDEVGHSGASELRGDLRPRPSA